MDRHLILKVIITIEILDVQSTELWTVQQVLVTPLHQVAEAADFPAAAEAAEAAEAGNLALPNSFQTLCNFNTRFCGGKAGL